MGLRRPQSAGSRGDVRFVNRWPSSGELARIMQVEEKLNTNDESINLRGLCGVARHSDVPLAAVHCRPSLENTPKD